MKTTIEISGADQDREEPGAEQRLFAPSLGMPIECVGGFLRRSWEAEAQPHCRSCALVLRGRRQRRKCSRRRPNSSRCRRRSQSLPSKRDKLFRRSRTSKPPQAQRTRATKDRYGSSGASWSTCASGAMMVGDAPLGPPNGLNGSCGAGGTNCPCAAGPGAALALAISKVTLSQQARF